MAYVNITKGARAIHLKAGGHVLVEPGATIDIDEGKIKRVGPGLVLAPNDLPPAPDGLAEAVSLSGKTKAELTEIAEAEGVTLEDGATVAQIKDAIEAARGDDGDA